MGDGTGENPTTRGEHRVSRRRVLAVGAAGVTGGLAGCSWGLNVADRRRETETLTPAPIREPSGFELATIDYPRTIEHREPVRYSFSVENTDNGGTRFFETTVRSTVPDTTRVFTHHVSGEIRPGTTRTFRLDEPSFKFLRHRDIRIGAFEMTFTIRSIAKTLAVGEWAFESNEKSLPDGLKIIVTDVAVVDDPSPDEETQWAFVTVSVRNTGGVGAIPAPAPAAFTLRTPGQHHEPAAPPDAMLPPSLAEDAYDDELIQLHGGTRGWIAYPLPDGRSVADLRVRLERSYDDGVVAIEWKPS